jgi:2-dehydropantoate 2-reductase
MIQKVYLSGLGAIGSAFAGRLYDMNPDCIKIIADNKRIEHYTRNGITINGKPYYYQYACPEENMPPADLILIAVKQHHLTQVIKDIRKFVGSDTIILSLLNGISSEEIIGSEFGMDKMLYSFCVGTDTVRDGTAVRYSNIGRIVFGEQGDSRGSGKVAAVKELFDRAGIPYIIPEDMLHELWWKFMMNVGINQASAVLRAPYGIFQKVPEARELLFAASREVIRISELAGINLNEGDMDKYMTVLNTLAPDGKTSMLQDVEAHRKTEVEIFAGTVIELGQKYRVDTPVNNVLFKMIRILEQM